MKEFIIQVTMLSLYLIVLCSQTYAMLTCKYIRPNTNMECSNPGIRHIVLKESNFPRNIRPRNQLKALWIKNSKISTINSNTFKNFGSIIELDISSNEIKSLNEGAFSMLPNLKSLNMSRNNIEILKPGHFENLKGMRRLDVSKNKLSLTDDAEAPLRNLTDLRTLFLSDNKAVAMHLVLNSPNLVTLIASNVEVFLSLENNVFAKSKKLAELEMSNAKLDKVPEDLFYPLEDLRKLVLSNNKIKSLPKDVFEKNSNLISLDLSGNTLHSIDVSIFSHTSSLMTLNLSRNKLDVFEEHTFSRLSQLISLDLSHNNLEDLAEIRFEDLLKLQYLDISHNHLEKLPDRFCSVCANLDYLDLSNNKLKSLDNNVMLKNGHLRFLHLSRNRLQSFPFSNDFNALQVLNLDSNDLTNIPVRLNYFSRLKYFKISCNKLSKLQEDFFVNFGRTDIEIWLHGNPWICHCLHGLLENAIDNGIEYHTEWFTDGTMPSCRSGTESCEDLVLDSHKLSNWRTFITHICWI